MRSSAKYRHLEISHVSPDDHFAAMQIDLCVRGWIDRFGETAACTIPISSRTMSVQLKEDTLPHKRTPFIILFPLRENKRRGNFPSAPNHPVKNNNNIIQLDLIHQDELDAIFRINSFPHTIASSTVRQTDGLEFSSL